MKLRQVIRCQKCRSPVLAFKTVMFPGDRLLKDFIDQNYGQVPWSQGMDMKCKLCGEPFGLQNITREPTLE